MWNVSDNRGEDLAEYLISQLVTIPLTDKEQAIAEYLIDLLDSRGYLTEEMLQKLNAYLQKETGKVISKQAKQQERKRFLSKDGNAASSRIL